MKKLFSIFTLCLISLLCTGQKIENSYFNVQSYKAQEEPISYLDWQLSNDGCWGCASFYYSVTRSYTYSGYKFDIWFYSNSTYSNGNRASTYINGIYVYVNGIRFNDEPIWLLFRDDYTNSLTSFVTQNPNPIIIMTWENIQVY